MKERNRIRCLVYIGLPTNPQFLGAQRPDDVAEVIRRNRGPSGENAEYLFMLEAALNGLGEGSVDEHVSDLAVRVRALEVRMEPSGEYEGGKAKDAVVTEVGVLQSAASDSHKVQEQIEKP